MRATIPLAVHTNKPGVLAREILAGRLAPPWADRLGKSPDGAEFFRHPTLPLTVIFDLGKSGVRLAWEHFHPDRLKIIAVGSGQTLPKALSTFGEVKEIKLSPEG